MRLSLVAVLALASGCEQKKSPTWDYPVSCQGCFAAIERARGCAPDAVDTTLADGFGLLLDKLYRAPNAAAKCETYKPGLTVIADALCANPPQLERPSPAEAREAWFPTDTRLPKACLDFRRQWTLLMACEKAKAAVEAMRESFEQMWKSLEAAPADAQAAMGAGCQTAADSIKTTLATMGC